MERLVISTINPSKNSILLPSKIIVSNNAHSCISLVDSGCTGEAFMDFSFAVRTRAKLERLPRPRPLYLANGVLSAWIEYRTRATLQVGDHEEELTFLITSLARQHPVILGLPWLRKHDPIINWRELTLQFRTNRCDRAAGIRAGEPVGGGRERDIAMPKGTPSGVRAATQSPTNSEDPGLEVGCLERTGAAAGPAGEAGTEQTGESRRAIAAKAGQRRLVRKRRRGRELYTMEKLVYMDDEIRIRRRKRRTPDRGEFNPMDATEKLTYLDDEVHRLAKAKFLSGPNFMLFARQEGVALRMVTWEELEEIDRVDPALDALHPAVSGLPDEFYKDLLERKGDLEDYKRKLPAQTHGFLEALWTDSPEIAKISEEDADRFFSKADRAPPTEEEIKKRLPKEYHDLWRVFLPQDADKLPPHRSFDHKIELLPGKQPPAARNRPMSPLELRVLKRFIDDNLAKGFIRPSRSSAASPVLLAKKPGGGVRICVDYRGLNAVTARSKYPIPLIRETLDAICRAKIFTKVDVIAAFNRIRVAHGHEWLTAFITRFGLYESLVTPFGLQGAPATFQNYINHLFHDLLDDFVTAYLDDVLVYSKSRSEHVKHVREVLRRLLDAGLQIDIDKCEFHTTKTKYLGLIVRPGKIEMDPEKVQAVRSWAPPTTKRQLQRFLGYANFYRRFIKDFSALTRPLHDLTKKGGPWEWSGECQRAFDSLKDRFATAPALQIYDWEKKTVVETDASNWASGGVLLQEDEEGQLRPVAYFSAKHSAQECNYDIYDKELLAIVKALEEWRPELEGAREQFDVVTDHKNLQTFMSNKRLSPRHMRWADFLTRFNFRITYRPGNLATLPDALSRKPEDVPQNEDDDRLRNRERALIPPERFDPRILEELGWQPEDGEDGVKLFEIDVSRHIDDLIEEMYEASPLLQQAAEAIRDPSCRAWPTRIRKRFPIPFAECTLRGRRIYFRDRLVVDPLDEAMHLQLIHRAHASGPAGHPGRTKTVDLLNRQYWWPGMAKAVRVYCKACVPCAKSKTPRNKQSGLLKPLPIPFSPWKDIAVDYITPLPECERRGRKFRHIAVVVDRLTRMRHFIPTETLEAEELADLFLSRVYAVHGLPESIVSDRGTQFVSSFWKALSGRLGITLRPTSALNPQANGGTERINADLEQFLRLFVNWAQDDWVDWLPLAEFAGNNAVSESTGLSPFFANYGFHPRMGIEPASPPSPEATEAQRREQFRANEVAERFKEVLDYVTAIAKQSQDRYEAVANRRREDAPRYKEGDWVLLDTENLKTGRPAKKLEPRWEGPFKVKSASSHSVTLDLPVNMKIHNTFHVKRVKPFEGNAGLPGQDPGSDIRANYGRVVTRTDDGREVVEWKFNRILDCYKAENGRWQYLIEWDGHEPTWQPASDLRDCPEAVRKFHEENPDKPKPPNLRLGGRGGTGKGRRRSPRLERGT